MEEVNSIESQRHPQTETELEGRARRKQEMAQRWELLVVVFIAILMALTVYSFFI